MAKWETGASGEGKRGLLPMFSTYRCMETIRLANELLEERKEMEKREQKGKPKGETESHDIKSHGTRYVSASGL